MNPLRDKRVLLGITGGIAACKCADLVRRLRSAGAGVTAVLTRNAERFITPLTLATLTERKVYGPMFADGEHGIPHIELAQTSHLMLIAPATANIIAKMRAGLADDLLSTIALAATCPVFIAPSMNTAMYEHPAVQENLEVLRQRGVQIIPPGIGELACHTIGTGRMAEPAEIVAWLDRLLQANQDLAGIDILVTAGPTREAIDPVRFLSNRSTGRMGYALAEAAMSRGARVTLVSGPTCLSAPAGVQLIPVTSAAEMLAAVRAHHAACRILIMAAAVADYAPTERLEHKIKKQFGQPLRLDLASTPDILAEMAAVKGDRIHVGFAAETADHLANARKKMTVKQLNVIALNDVSRTDAGFASTTNQLTVLTSGGEVHELPLMSKLDAANALLNIVADCLD
ncbi:bifunctional phosphopantothenoylcysteine decarboxylase/phosphopantothenate--cysteine ligase CoaBC [bacterium]|nr:bifunctional phosphopantothenoylcysteine decarboxylase/phosphopantothenate--cysteine ligase CoaBC [candidate division CSSED10-310 bacterium]